MKTAKIDSVNVKLTAIRQKCEEIYLSGKNARNDLKSGFELSWSAMSEALSSAKSRFR